MRNLKVIIASLLLVLSLLDCFDVCLFTALKCSSNSSNQTSNTLVTHHHQHQEEVVLDEDNSVALPLEKQQQLLPNSDQLAASSFITSIWQPPQAA